MANFNVSNPIPATVVFKDSAGNLYGISGGSGGGGTSIVPNPATPNAGVTPGNLVVIGPQIPGTVPPASNTLEDTLIPLDEAVKNWFGQKVTELLDPGTTYTLNEVEDNTLVRIVTTTSATAVEYYDLELPTVKEAGVRYVAIQQEGKGAGFGIAGVTFRFLNAVGSTVTFDFDFARTSDEKWYVFCINYGDGQDNPLAVSWLNDANLLSSSGNAGYQGHFVILKADGSFDVGPAPLDIPRQDVNTVPVATVEKFPKYVDAGGYSTPAKIADSEVGPDDVLLLDPSNLPTPRTASQLVNSDVVMGETYQILGKASNGTENSLIGHHEYSTGAKATEVGNEETPITLNGSYDALGPHPPDLVDMSSGSAVTYPVDERPYYNYKKTDSSGVVTPGVDAVALVVKDVAPIRNRLSQLSQLGSYINSVDLITDLPSNISQLAPIVMPVLSHVPGVHVGAVPVLPCHTSTHRLHTGPIT